MKTTLLITVSALAAFGLISTAQQADKPSITGEKADPASIYGAYELKLGDGAIRKRFIANGRWAIVQSHPPTGDVIFHHGGSYIFDRKNYIEKVEYAAPATRNLIGNNHRFIITVQEGAIQMKGVDNPWDEVWVRVDDKSQQDAVDLSVPTVPPKKGGLETCGVILFRNPIERQVEPSVERSPHRPLTVIDGIPACSEIVRPALRWVKRCGIANRRPATQGSAKHCPKRCSSLFMYFPRSCMR